MSGFKNHAKMALGALSVAMVAFTAIVLTGCDTVGYDIVVKNGVKSHHDRVVGYTKEIPEQVDLAGYKAIESGAFKNCRQMRSVSIPDSVVSIGPRAFAGCRDSLFDMRTIPGVRLVDGWAIGVSPSFSGTMDLMGVRGIADEAFRDCKGLTDVTFPRGQIHIGQDAFAGCDQVLCTNKIPGVTFVANHLLSVNSSYKGSIDLTGVNSIVDGAFLNCSDLTDVTFPNNLEIIGEYTFQGCSSLTKVAIPDSVTFIGKRAFGGCSRLSSVEIGRGVARIDVDAFYGCRQIKNFTVSADNPCYKSAAGMLLTKDGKTLLYGVNGDIVIPDGVETVAPFAFAGRYGRRRKRTGLFALFASSDDDLDGGVTRVTFPKSVRKIGAEAFAGCTGLADVTILGSVTNIEERVFSGCSSLTRVTLPEGLNNIGRGVFMECGALTEVGIPQSVTKLGRGAFYRCSQLKNVTIPDGVTHISEIAFWACSELGNVRIGKGVTYIGKDAFDHCNKLTEFAVSAENPSYRSVSGMLLTKDGKTLVRGINGDVVIPDGVETIAERAFYGYEGLTSVKIPGSVTNIMDGAFASCGNLNHMKIDGTILSFGKGAFWGCEKLTAITIGAGAKNIRAADLWRCGKIETFIVSKENPTYQSVSGMLLTKDGKMLVRGIGGKIVIPDGVKYIGDFAFSGCEGLTSVKIPGSVIDIGDEAFCGCSGLTSAKVGEGVVSIGKGAFTHCTKLKNVTFPDGVTEIGDEAFTGCNALTSVTIPKDAKLGKDVFSKCVKVERR